MEESDSKPDSSEHIPLEPSDSEPKPMISRESLSAQASDEADLCPNCSSPMPDKDALVCLKCGYDIKTNTKVRTRLGVVEVEEVSDFCKEGKLPWQGLVGAGAVCVAVSMVLAWMRAPEDASSFLMSLRVLVYGLVHTGLGVVAIITTAMLMQQRVGRIEFGVGWMSVAVGLFFLSIELGHMLGAGVSAQWIVGRLLGAGLYAAVLWMGLKLARDVLLLIAGMQFIFWLILWAYVSLGRHTGAIQAAAELL